MVGPGLVLILISAQNLTVFGPVVIVLLHIYGNNIRHHFDISTTISVQGLDFSGILCQHSRSGVLAFGLFGQADFAYQASIMGQQGNTVPRGKTYLYPCQVS